MADTKISALPAVVSLSGTEVIPVVQSGVTKKASISQIPIDKTVDNTWTGQNTFQNHSVLDTSTDNAVFFPESKYSYPGLYTPIGRLQFGWTPLITLDNPDEVHSQLTQSINWDQFNATSDDGSGIYNMEQLEFRYQGAAVATITSIVVSGGVGTFTVSTSTPFYINGGIAVRGNSVSNYNTYWKITSSPSAGSFTAVRSSGTATTGTGTGGDIRFEQNEWNATSDGFRWGYMFSRNGNASQDGGLQYFYPLEITVPTNYSTPSLGPSFALGIDGSISSSHATGGIVLNLANGDTTNARSEVRFQNTKTGHTAEIILDPGQTGSDDFVIYSNGSPKFAINGTTGNIILGGNASSDDAIHTFQVNGTQSILTSLTIGVGAVDGGVLSLKSRSLTASTPNTAQFAPSTGQASYIHYGTTGDIYWRSASSSGMVTLNDSGGNVNIGNTSGTNTLTGVCSVASGDISTTTIGKTLKVKSGTNAKAGTFTLVAGTTTIANTSVTANSVIVCTLKTLGGTRVGNPDIVPTATTGFVATGAGTDTSTYNFVILEVS